MRIRENGRPTRDLWHRTDIGRHHGTGACHRLQNRQTEGLVERGIHQEVSGSVEVNSFLIWHSSDEDHVATDAELGDQLVEFGRVLLVTLGAENDELAAGEL